jgi:LemA protein
MDPRASSLGGSLPEPFDASRARSFPALGIALLLALGLLAPASVALWAHNQMLGRAEAVEAAWAQVESNFQRRADLIPRLVETVNRALHHESELLTAVTRERGAARGAALEALAELQRAHRQAQATAEPRDTPGAVGSAEASRLERIARHEAALGRGVQAVIAVAESYPELRSADQFLELQAQLEGTENRINVARMAFTDAVREYNAALVSLPTRFVARAEKLERRPYFRAEESARVAQPLGLE